MRKGKILAVLLGVLMLTQASVFAEPAPPDGSGFPGQEAAAQISPRGLYLWKGLCSITPMSGQVVVDGMTRCFDKVDEVGVTLIVYRNLGGSIWSEVWRDTYRAYGASVVYSPAVTVNVSSGNYKIVAEHYAIFDGGRTENISSQADPVTVY